METDAIPQDVSPEEPQEKQPVLSEREQAMQAIQAELAAQYGEPQQEEEPQKPEATPETPAVQTVRVKVDGQEKELPIEEVVKGYQKDTVASRRLEEAARKQRELEQREAEIAERERQIAAAQVPSPVDEQDDSDEIAAAINALVDGDNEAAAKFLRDAVKKGRQAPTPTVNPEEIAAQVAAQVESKQAATAQAREFQEFVAANPVFADPQPDEEGNVILSKERVRGDYLFDTIYAPKWQRGEISYREALDKTAAHVAQEFTPPTPPSPVDAREQRKQKIDNLPVASGARVAATPKERTPEDALEDMRKWRGQAV